MQVTAGRLALTATGLLFTWSGLAGASVSGSIRDLISGQKPEAGTNPITGTGGGAGQTGSAIANQALTYRGDPYVWGGANFPKGGDCSGLVNDVVGRDLGMAIPGYPTGKFTGHGPVTSQWFAWNGAATVAIPDMQAGDLVCWITHMGIAISGGQMISALNPSLGVMVTTVAGAAPPGEPMRIRRLKA